MGIKEHLEGVYPRTTSILVDFRWNGKRYRERVNLRPTIANQRVAARLRDEILHSIRLDKFTWADFSRYFPDSPRAVNATESAGPMTFDAAADRWLLVVKPQVAATTLDEYENTLNNYWRPTLGEREIADITYEDLLLEISELPPLAAKTFNNAMTPLRGIWAMATKTGRVPTNITLEIDSRKGQKPPPDPLEINEVLLVLDHLRDHFAEGWWNYFAVAFFAGLRPSEAIALRWNRVDFRREQVRIDSARVRRVDKGTKTMVVRDVDLQELALEALQRQKRITYDRGEMVFLNPVTGDRLTDTAAPLAIWHQALAELGIRERDARQTRHTYATMGLHAGMNPGYLSRQMGHKNAKMFFEVYSKWIDGAANQREKDKMRRLVAQHQPAESGQAD